MTMPADDPGASGRDARIRFLVRLARGLHMYGTPAHRIEEALEYATDRLGIPSQFFALPTVILASFGAPDERSTGLIRVAPGSVHLEKLVQLDDVMKDLLRGALTPEEGARRVDAIEHLRPRWNFATTLLAYGVVAGCAARFFGGGLADIVASALFGLLPGLLERLARLRAGFARVHVPLSAFVVSFAALLLAQRFGEFSTYIVTVSSLIVLLPGLALTLAMSELAAQSLVAGTVNLVRAAMIFLELGFGVALGRTTAARFFAFREVVAAPLPAWTLGVALLLAPVCYTVLFRARPRDLLPILGTGILGFAAAWVGSSTVGVDLAGFVGAFVVGVASNLWARRKDRPVAVTLLPGILLLVPGSVGFRGLLSLLDAQVVNGVETAFRMALIAASIVAGLLLANVAAPARRPF